MKFNILPLLTDIAETTAVAEAASSTTDLMNSTLTFGERITTGLEVMLFGMAVVFAVLILLWGILEIFRVIFYEIPKKKAAETEAKPAEADNVPAPAPVIEEAVEEVAETDDAEVVAAITAAISVMLDKPQTSFRVVSFRRTASK